MQAIDIIILIVVAVLLLLALRSTLRHYSGKGGGCCGCSGCSGGSSSCSTQGSVKTAKSAGEFIGGNSLSKTLQINGMHCNTCKQSVESALSHVSGVICADVDLEAGTAEVFMKEEVTDLKLKEAVENKGFEVKEIRKAG
ncbi:heavy-metal-associated domain-containing protein [Clostridium transplantifaecale]|uniref:heavy-metal-associated domain-containing protein n=1 Tax=Clostridium transplantifaecale TaxID=2479838 RepID=UPI000F63ACCC|nr:heavy metal-associated domain-containing protein [Clostridium transplantifaecale]